MSFIARFPGRCDGCDNPITAGQPINRVENDDFSAYLHEGCEPEYVDTSTPTEPYCDQCWTFHNGSECA